MGRQKIPVELVVLRGRSHIGKDEIAQRRAEEIEVPCDKVKPPEYLNAAQKCEFRKISKQLIELNIMSNLDCDALARFLIANSDYRKYTELLNSIPADVMHLESLKDASLLQSRAFDQCRKASSDLGLTITSRCKLVVPKQEEKKVSKFDRLGGSG